MDKFHEQLVGTQEGVVYKALGLMRKITLAAAIITGVVSAFFFNLTMLVMAAILFILSHFVDSAREKQYIEFEYIFTEGNFQIDAIYNKKKRKTIIDKDIKQFEYFGSAKDFELDGGYDKIFCIPKDNKDEKYVFTLVEGKKKAVYISPDNETIRLINTYYFRGRRR